MRFTLRDAHLIDATTDISRGAITIEGTHILGVACPAYSDEQQDNIIDATGMILMPGFIDVHTHGGGIILQTDAGEIRALHAKPGRVTSFHSRWAPDSLPSSS
jgi:N-acetylglucosamine-6-phosphate deacetylase